MNILDFKLNFYQVPLFDPAVALFIRNVVTLLGHVAHFVESFAAEQVSHE